MANFEALLKRLSSRGIRPNTKTARDWFRKKIRDTKISKASLLSDSDRKSSRPTIGKMYFFAYDPKYKEKLPYYDTFPLIFVVDYIPNGFLGINLHYVSPRNRIILMDSLSSIASNDKYDSSTKLRLTYGVLKRLGKFDMIKPCIKKYLYNHTRSHFVTIDANEWDIAIFLPVQKFVKASPSKVWSDSARK